MKTDTSLESANQKIKNAQKQAVQSGTHNVSVIITEQEHKAFMWNFCAELTEPSHHCAAIAQVCSYHVPDE
ncbi:hypothetical protein [Erwinia persicina]|uniref:hypothetical protein n=1 Tax=Erwinia persicina TaxID=55211 RepID=UPI0017853BF3|nr:hypothetical protein [Erwinia persicina]MBD8165411.1 hypothetical protein [Erwinia persicina]